nr:hypothetical protein Q903MT_gene6505 [Picea sitchensis]
MVNSSMLSLMPPVGWWVRARLDRSAFPLARPKLEWIELSMPRPVPMVIVGCGGCPKPFH